MISTISNFIPTKKAGGGGVSISANWVAVGRGGLIAKSSDGNLWSPAGSVGGITEYGYGVAYGKDGAGAGLWVAVGGGSIIAKSSDGNLWSPAATVSGVSGKGGITNFAYGVAYGKDSSGGNLWVAVGQGSVIAKSSDGNLWSQAINVGGLTYGYGVAYGKDGAGGNLWVAVGGGSIIAKSSDGNLWSPAATVSGVSGKGGITNGRGIAYGRDGSGANLWVAVGDDGGIAKSSDGNLWSAAATSADGSKGGITTFGYGVAYGKDSSGAGLWVAVGNSGVIAKSSDGNIWSPAGSLGGITYGACVAYGKDDTGAGLWVVGGNDGILAKSSDGNLWSRAGSLGGINSAGWGVAFKNEEIPPIVLIGNDGTYSYAYTNDLLLLKWSYGNIGSTYANFVPLSIGCGIYNSAPLWVAIGKSGTTFYSSVSTNGTIWSVRSSSINSIFNGSTGFISNSLSFGYSFIV